MIICKICGYIDNDVILFIIFKYMESLENIEMSPFHKEYTRMLWGLFEKVTAIKQ